MYIAHGQTTDRRRHCNMPGQQHIFTTNKYVKIPTAHSKDFN